MPTRRDLLQLAAGLGLGSVLGPARAFASVPSASGLKRQSVCRWPFSAVPDAEFFPMVKGLGFGAVDLLTEREWPLAEAQGLICSMGTPTERRDFIKRGLNDPANHPLLLKELEQAIVAGKRHGVPNIIAMIGNREGRSDAAGLAACTTALNQIKSLAEESQITICLELLNSRVDHADFMGDRMSFGLELMRAVNSPRVRLLYDIYHMQIMEGDVIRTIRDQHQWIAHYHTAGNPGRHELDASQELNYAAIAAAIAGTGFTGWAAHEFIPTRDPKLGLAEAREVCS